MTGGPAPPWFVTTLSALLDRRDLSHDQMHRLVTGLLGDELDDVDVAAALVALRAKGETADELAAAAGVMRQHCKSFRPEQESFLDTCGTGGSGRVMFNISTATAFVVAGSGLAVVKHGNRSMSNATTSSADVLTALGVPTDADPHASLAAANMAFCLAPLYHPAAARVGAVRRRRGGRTR
ncbi:MAG: anthranilate phosphoribosyltransferase, partial [Gemmataceae bacterium]